MNRYRIVAPLTAFVLVFVVLGGGVAAAQDGLATTGEVGGTELRGVVRDGQGAAVTGAIVQFANPARTLVTRTGSKGEFRFSIPDGWESAEIAVKASSFAPVRRTVTPADSNLSFVLQPASLQEQITVTATRSDTAVADTPVNVAIIGGEELRQLPALTVDDRLRQAPGFSTFRRTGSRAANPTTQGVSLRGLGASGASRALVLYDGVPLNDPFGGWVYWGRVPELAVDRVEIVRGGGSDLFGASALGGVVNVIAADRARTQFAADVSGGSLGTGAAGASASLNWGKTTLSLSGDSLHTGGYYLLHAEDRGAADSRAGTDDRLGEARLEHRFDNDAWFFARGSLFNETRENGTRLQGNRTRIRQIATGADLPVTAGIFRLRSFGTLQTYRQTFTGVADDRNSENLIRLQFVPAQQEGGSVAYAGAIRPWLSISAGTEYTFTRGDSDELQIAGGNAVAQSDSGGRQHNTGAFVNALVRLSQRTWLQAGLRYDRWTNANGFSSRLPLATRVFSTTLFADRDESAWSPRVGLVQRVSDRISLRASGYRAFRAPTLNELYRAFRVGDVNTLANESLRAERLTGGEAGVRAAGSRASIHATYFYAVADRSIGNVTLSVTPAVITRQRQNLGRIRAQGVEFESGWRPASTLTVFAGYQFVNSVVVSAAANPALVGRDVPQAPHNVFTTRALWSPRGWTLSFAGRFNGQQFDDDQNRFALERFFVADAMLARELTAGLSAFVAMENLFNERYAVGKTPLETFGAPFAVRAGLRVRLVAK